MKTPLLLAALAFVSTAAFGQSADQKERIEASFVLALGRAPSAAETQAWSRQPAASLAELIQRHERQLGSDAGARQAVAKKAFQDAFGRAPTAAELGTAVADAVTYTELLERHVQRLAGDPAEYAKVLERAYQLVIRREVYPEELDYWKKHDTLPFTLLVGAVEDWARRNQPGLMVTAGKPTISVNSEFLATVRLSPGIAAEARRAAGLAAPENPEARRHVIAPGASTVTSSGGIHLVVAGGPNLAAGTTN